MKIKINQSLQKIRTELASCGVLDFEIEALMILSFVLKKPKEYIFTHFNDALSYKERFKIKRLLKKRQKNIPLPYLLEEKDFYGLTFFVNKNVLIPRPETELIVDEVIKINKNYEKITLIDVGTGSGAIPIALAKNINAEIIAIDVSSPALCVALKNSKRLEVSDRIKFIKSDLLTRVVNTQINNPLVISANLPYLTPQQVKESPTIQKEPKIALIGGKNGLLYYEKLFKQVNKMQIKQDMYILCEIDETQTENIKKLIVDNFKKVELEVKKDLAGFDRLIVITLK